MKGKIDTTRNSTKVFLLQLLFSTVLLLIFAASLSAQTPSFTYQGRLTDGGTAANGNYDLQFALFNSADGGTPIATQTIPTVAVSAGIFTVQLDFGGGAFPGPNRWLEIRARLSGAPAFTSLSPRQQITSTPYAIRSLNAASADTVPISGVPSGSGNYIQNTSSPQAGANFNIAGNGLIGGNLAVAGSLSLNVVNANTQFNLGNARILSQTGQNLAVGIGTGPASTTGIDNTFVGSFTGNNATAGDANSFFGVSSGFNNQGTANSFFGRSSGFQNTSGSQNSFFGVQAGRDNSTGNNNSFFGHQAGFGSTGNENSFFGFNSGSSNRGANNAFFGANSGVNNTTGSSNAFFGRNAGRNNSTGIGNVYVGVSAGSSNTTASLNTFVGFNSGFSNTTGGYNVFIGNDTGFSNTTGSKITLIGRGANVQTQNLDHATAIGAETIVGLSNHVQIGRVGIDTVAIGAFPLGATSTHLCITSQGVFAACVGGGQPEAEGHKYDQVTSDLIKAVEEQRQQILSLKAEIAALRRNQEEHQRQAKRTQASKSQTTNSRQR